MVRGEEEAVPSRHYLPATTFVQVVNRPSYALRIIIGGIIKGMGVVFILVVKL
jgi:hypothetical protein